MYFQENKLHLWEFRFFNDIFCFEFIALVSYNFSMNNIRTNSISSIWLKGYKNLLESKRDVKEAEEEGNCNINVAQITKISLHSEVKMYYSFFKL